MNIPEQRLDRSGWSGAGRWWPGVRPSPAAVRHRTSERFRRVRSEAEYFISIPTWSYLNTG